VSVVDLAFGLLLLLAIVALVAFVVVVPFLVLIWLYDIRTATKRQADLLERMGRAQGWLPATPPKR